MQPVQLVSMATVPGEMENVLPLDDPPEADPPQPASTNKDWNYARQPAAAQATAAANGIGGANPWDASVAFVVPSSLPSSYSIRPAPFRLLVSRVAH